MKILCIEYEIKIFCIAELAAPIVLYPWEHHKNDRSLINKEGGIFWRSDGDRYSSKGVVTLERF